MPKIKRQYYRRAREIANSVINTIQCENITPLLSDIPSGSNNNLISNNSILNNNNVENNNELSYEDCDNSQHNDYNDLEREREDSSNYNSDSDPDDRIPTEHINFVNNFEFTNTNNDSPNSIISWFQEWSIKNNITHVALNELISRIKPKYPELPKDARTLLGTPRKVNIDVVAPGHYYHFGLSNSIETLLSRCPFQNLHCIEVNINIDGLPLFKSSSSQVYPILCNLVENYNEVDVVGIYHGYEKPADANVFLQSFAEEARNLTIHGVKIKGRTYSFKIRSFICDVPAKSFITYTKGHSGYCSCSKCTVEGEYYSDRVIYPYLNSGHLRSDNDFRLKLQENHHTGTSILESIPNINMVSDFPSDSMHLMYLGIVKKLVLLWCYGKRKTKLSFSQMSAISKLLTDQRENIPSEFNRKSRSLFQSKRWKATEFRTFLLYTGPVVLKSILNHDQYLNFLTLHVATTILSNSKHIKQYLDYSKSLLQYFVETFITLYGKENASHNVHHLLHICDDAEKFGTLQEFSAFPFENYLQSILKMIRKNNKELEQIVCRISERNYCISRNLKVRHNEPEFLNPHCNGPLINSHNCNQFSKVVFKQFILKIYEPDNCCRLKDGNIIVIRNFVVNNEGSVVIGNKYRTLIDFYTAPCESSKLDIYLVSDIGNLESWDLKQIANKCMKLKFKNKYVVFPLLHSD